MTQIANIQRRLRGPFTNPVVRAIDRVFRLGIQERFDAQSDSRGNPWAPLSPDLQAYKQQRGLQPLVDTGRLLNSLTDENHPEHYVSTNRRNSLLIGTRVPYARFQGEGTATIPARPFFPSIGRQAAMIIGRYVLTGRVR